MGWKKGQWAITEKRKERLGQEEVGEAGGRGLTVCKTLKKRVRFAAFSFKVIGKPLKQEQEEQYD